MPPEFWNIITIALPIGAALWTISNKLGKIEQSLSGMAERISRVEACTSDLAKLSERVIRLEEKLHQ